MTLVPDPSNQPMGGPQPVRACWTARAYLETGKLQHRLLVRQCFIFPELQKLDAMAAQVRTAAARGDGVRGQRVVGYVSLHHPLRPWTLYLVTMTGIEPFTGSRRGTLFGYFTHDSRRTLRARAPL